MNVDLNWKFINSDQSESPVWNMAADEYVLSLMDLRQPLLRLYGWSESCITIGYFQDISNVRSRAQNNSLNKTIVRRISGGGMVEHDQDLTLSLVIPEAHSIAKGSVSSSYHVFHQLLVKVLNNFHKGLSIEENKLPSNSRGLRPCFGEPTQYDIMLDGKKVVGSSQRRSRGRVLYQSSIQLPLDYLATQDVLRQIIETEFGVVVEMAGWDDQDRGSISQLIQTKYTKPENCSCISIA